MLITPLENIPNEKMPWETIPYEKKSSLKMFEFYFLNSSNISILESLKTFLTASVIIEC